MPLPLAVLLEGISALKSVVQQGREIVDSIRVKRHDDEAKERLTKALDDVQEKLKHVGQVAEYAESYFRTHENVLELLTLCQRAQQFAADNSEEMRRHLASEYEGDWRLVETLFQRIDQAQEAPRKVLFDRSEWWDDRDKHQVEGKLNDFHDAYQEATGLVRSKNGAELAGALRNMIRALMDADVLLRDTVYEQILATLQKLGA